ncbi:MAG TPA: YncE family protein [Pyrinomonadaceae bacterium]|nr:YncE family protein [Pyrinomonadaceae bacterium]
MSPNLLSRLCRIFSLLILFSTATAATAHAAQQCRLYATDYRTASVRQMDCKTNQTLAPITVGVQPFGIVASPDGEYLYVANYGSNSISVINTDSNVPYYTAGVDGAGPIGVAISPDGTRLYVANFDSSSVSVLNVGSNTTPTVIGKIQFPDGSRPDNVAFSADGSVVYVALWGAAKVAVIDTTSANYQVVQTINVGHSPSAFVVAPDGKRVYVTNEFGGPSPDAYNGSISVLDSTNPKQNTVLAEWLLPDDSFPMQQSALSANGRYLYVPGEGNASLFTIDTNDGTIKDTKRIGVGPQAAALSPDGARVFVSIGHQIASMETGWNNILPEVVLGTQTSWLLNIAIVNKCP